MDTGNISINTHSSIRVEGSVTVYFDPYQIEETAADADVICFTHSHYDHFEPESAAKLRKENTVFVAPLDMKKDLKALAPEENIRLMAPGDEIAIGDTIVRAVPAYNKLKPFHPKHNKWLGYVLTMDGTSYYVAGDTDANKELQEISCDIALVPVGGTYTMTAKDAAGLINAMRPAAAIPTHYGNIVGKAEDGETFRSLVDPEIETVIKL